MKALDGDHVAGKDESVKKEGKDKPKEIGDTKDVRDVKVAKGGKADSKGIKNDGKGGAGDKPICRYFLSESGCKKGQKCSFPHEWKGTSKMGRCWNCGLSQHMWSECPVKDAPRVKKESSEDKKGKEMEGKPGDAQGSSSATSGMFLPPSEQQSAPAEALVKEAVQLLKSLRPSIKAGLCSEQGTWPCACTS